MRFLAAIVMNMLVPGAGLILLGRAWTGLTTAVLFAICAELALCGVLISPAGIPAWLTVAAGALAGATWLLGQWMLRDRLGVLRNPSLPRELETLRQDALRAIERGDLMEAQGLLRLALDLDPDAVETLVVWAELMTLLGRFRESRRAWRRVERCGESAYTRQAVQALARLPAG